MSLSAGKKSSLVDPSSNSCRNWFTKISGSYFGNPSFKISAIFSINENYNNLIILNFVLKIF